MICNLSDGEYTLNKYVLYWLIIEFLHQKRQFDVCIRVAVS